MLGVVEWLRALLAGEAPHEPTNDTDLVTDHDEARAPDHPGQVWDRDPHAALQVIRYRKVQRLISERGLPPELVRHILLLAEEARTLSASRAETMVYTDDANECYLRTPPLPSKLLRHFLLRVVVDIDSHDQGWSSDPNRSWLGTYQGSYTWWELSLDRQGADGEWAEVHRVHLTHNIHASHDFRRHTLTFTAEDPVVSDAQPGDVLSLWARTQFMAWVNIVRYARISVWIDWEA
ncbi:hypothetical protein MOBT1_000056 [Malassezia obtusa]|uniref:Uncharacterized protein n=1 Tax=Malassezia obtusa TaxID=76774 RepID=A0AAF0E1G1_9BASI|nr:hypothetical protein MOBT1_000056 [Malassezia obtusa]